MINFVDLSEKQIEQAIAIAQYDVCSAARYCKFVAARNQRKCPVCGGELVRSGGIPDNYICSGHWRSRHEN